MFGPGNSRSTSGDETRGVRSSYGDRPHGDLILRSDWEPFLTQTNAWWEKNAIPHEVLAVDEVRKRWPQFAVNDIKAVLHEPDAGVVASDLNALSSQRH